MVNDIKKQKILMIFSLLLLFLFVFLLVDSIIKMNKKLSYDDLLYYEGEYLSKSIIKDSDGGPDTYKILISGVDKPFTINNLVSKEVRLKVLDLQVGEQLYFYVLDNKNTVVEFGTNMPFITLEDYNEYAHHDALAGVIIMTICCISTTCVLFVCYIKIKKGSE